MFGQMHRRRAHAERASRVARRKTLRIVSESRHLLRRRNHHLLHNVVRLGFLQAGLERGVVNQSPIDVEKLAPALLIADIFEPGE